jgi:hypothetical protein
MKQFFTILIASLFVTIVFGQTENDSRIVKRFQELQQDRFKILIDRFYNQKFDKIYFERTVSILDTNINTDFAFQAIFNKDSTKFVAFFLTEITDPKIIEQVKIGVEDSTPYITKQYLVSEIKYKDKWYYSGTWYGYNYVYLAKTRESRQKDFFNQLQDYEFFEENSVKLNSKFWDSRLFGKIKIPEPTN